MVRFISGSVGSLWLVFLSWFLSLILEIMVSGKGVWFDLILPLGMWCLSAVSMALVMVLFAM